ncbi:MAG: DUF7064 domain-containing protein [Acidimicrobiales bacterium]
MPILDRRHDLAHPVESDRAWSESYYFNAYDPPSDTGFFTRIGIRPNEGTVDVGLSVWMPGDELAEYRFLRSQPHMIDTILAVGAVRYEMIEPMAAWRLTMDGETLVRPCRDRAASGRPAPIALDVTFSALTPAVGVDGQGRAVRAADASASTAASTGKGHLEQAGRWTGWLAVDGTRHEWSEARGNRDKSWGPRRWGGPRVWRWFSINVGDDTHFGGIRIGTDAGDLHRGWMWRDGRATSIREWRVRTEVEDDGVTHRTTHVQAIDKTGGEHGLRGDVLRVASVGFPGRSGTATVVNEGLTRWTYEGRTGFGIAEYLHQLDDDGRPVAGVE